MQVNDSYYCVPTNLCNRLGSWFCNALSKFSHRKQAEADVYNVPDKVTGLQGLSVLNPQRKWNFVHINVTKEELQRTR